MNLNAVATALRALADAIEDKQAPVTEAPVPEQMLEPEPPAPAPASTGAPAFNMYAPAAAAAAAPAQATTPAITKEDVISVAQKLTRAIGQNEANGFIGRALQEVGAERVSTATVDQLMALYGRFADRLKEVS